MKKQILLLLLMSASCFAQLSKADFEKQIMLTSGRDQAASLANLALLEKKMPTDAKVIFLRGFYQFRDGDLNGAMANISKALKVDPKFDYAFAGRAQLFSSKGMLDKAILDISEAIKLEPKNLDYLSTRLGFYFQNKQFELGLADIKTKIALNSKNIMDYFDGAVFEKKINQNANADLYFEQAYANKGIQKYVTDALFGKFLIKFGRFEEAKIKMEAALAAGEFDFDADDFNNAAIAYYKTKNYEKAITCSNKAIAKNPTDVNLYFNLASTYISLQEWQKVKDTAEKALNVNSESPMANMFMAVGLSNTGNQTKASEFEAKAKRLDAEQNK